MNTVPVSQRKLEWSLLLLRVGIFIVFAMWTIDKFVNPAHAAGVFEKYYKIGGLSSTLTYVIGAVQSVVILAFVAGAFRNVTYAIILALHTVSTLSSYGAYFDPWTKPNLLFFAAIPMLAACIALWLLRNHDNLLSVDGRRVSAKPTD